eukprot:5863037-Pyramimonas_sp.AAC.1
MSPQGPYGLLKIPHDSSGSLQGALQDSLAFFRGVLRTSPPIVPPGGPKDALGAPGDALRIPKDSLRVPGILQRFLGIPFKDS